MGRGKKKKEGTTEEARERRERDSRGRGEK
jgi:hypothetical protein